MQTLTIQSPADGLGLSVIASPAPGRPRGNVQLVHGMCEHKERYIPFMEFLNSKGYNCIIHDNRGHGASVRQSEDLGYMYEAAWTAMIEDIYAVSEWSRENFPGLKHHLLGHSMGSMAVRSFIKRYDSLCDSLTVVGSPSDNPAKGAGKLLAELIALTRGERYRSHLLQKLSFGSYNKPFRDEGWSSAWVCSDEEILRQYHSDPLCQFIFTTNGFSRLMALMQDCYSRKGWNCTNPGLPVRFFSGADDPCAVSEEAMRKSVALLVSAGYRDVSYRFYPGMRHEILNEKGKEKVWEDIVSSLG